MEEGLLKPEDKIKEQIKFKTEMLRWIIVSILTIGGGTISQAFNENHTAEKTWLVASGILALIWLFWRGYRMYIKTKKLIE